MFNIDSMLRYVQVAGMIEMGLGVWFSGVWAMKYVHVVRGWSMRQCYVMVVYSLGSVRIEGIWVPRRRLGAYGSAVGSVEFVWHYFC